MSGASRASGAAASPSRDEGYHAVIIPASTLAGLVEYARAQRKDPEVWFTPQGLSAELCFDPDARMSFHDVAQVLHAALRDFPSRALGISAGAQLTLPSLGLLGFSLMSSPTLGAAAMTGQKFHPISGSLMDVRYRMANGEFVLEAVERFPAPALHRFLCEKFFASALTATRALLGEDYRPLRLELSYAEPSCAPEYRRFFGCPVRFGADGDRMYSDPAMLQRSIPTRSASSHAEALRLLETKMPVPVPTDPVAALRDWLRRHLGRSPRITEAAHELQFGERTLRRRLAAENTSFRALHDELRAEQAQALLRDPQRSVVEVAGTLGFSDEREFRRAFKRWTGHSPRSRRPQG